MLGLARTCIKLKIPFFDYLGDRLAIPGKAYPFDSGFAIRCV
jgi:hypothetical protein